MFTTTKIDEITEMNYTTVTDAMTALINSGVFDWFDFDRTPEEEVARWMFRHAASPDEAAEHFGVDK